MAKITLEEIRNVAFLSRLVMTDGEMEIFKDQLGKILEYASVLDELDIKDVEPTSHVVPLKNVFREDEVKPSLPVEEALANAPDPAGNFFTVPRIIDEGGGH